MFSCSREELERGNFEGRLPPQPRGGSVGIFALMLLLQTYKNLWAKLTRTLNTTLKGVKRDSDRGCIETQEIRPAVHLASPPEFKNCRPAKFRHTTHQRRFLYFQKVGCKIPFCPV
jgi:hypothetical protein